MCLESSRLAARAAEPRRAPGTGATAVAASAAPSPAASLCPLRLASVVCRVLRVGRKDTLQ